MVKKYLNFSTHRRGHLPAIKSRRLGGREFMTAAYKSHGEDSKADSEKTDEELLADIAEQAKAFNAALGEKADKNALTKMQADIEALAKALKDQDSVSITEAIKSINKANEKMHREIAEMQEEAAKKAEANEGAAKQNLTYNLDSLKAFAKECLDKSTTNVTPFEIQGVQVGFRLKAAETFGYPQTFVAGTDISAFTGRVVDPVLYQRRRKTNIILDYMDMVSIGVPKLIYLNKIEIGDTEPVSGDPGGADWISCGDQKPKRSFRLGSQEVTAKKVAIFAEVEDCILEDITSLETWIREDLMDEMREKFNEGLLSGDPDVDPLLPLGMKTNAVQYTPTPAYVASVVEPNYIDAIFALAAFFAFNRENLARVFVASDVYYRIMHLKDSDARYLNNNLIYTTALGELYIGGVHVVKVDEEDIPSTHVFAIGADNGFKIRPYGAMHLEKGLNGENFREDKTSFRGWQRVISYIPEDRENSVLYDTWANIFAAINKPATT